MTKIFSLITKNRSDKESFPSFWENLFFVIILIFCDDFCFYWSHRFLHNKYIYKQLHKLHHDIYDTYTISCICSHPIEFITNILNSYIPALAMGSNMHIVSLATYTIWQLLETHETHSGY